MPSWFAKLLELLLVTLMLSPLRTFSTKGGCLHVPGTKCIHHTTPSRRVEDVRLRDT
jgi:hypothetical protein